MAKKMIKPKDGSYSQRGLWDNIRANKGSGKKPTKEMLEQERKIKNKNKMGGKRKLMKKGGKSEFGMLSVKAGVDNNPNPTAADRIVGAKKGKKKMGMGGKKMMYQTGGGNELAGIDAKKFPKEAKFRKKTNKRLAKGKSIDKLVDKNLKRKEKQNLKNLKKPNKKKMMGGGMKKMMYKSGGFLEPAIPNIDDL